VSSSPSTRKGATPRSDDGVIWQIEHRVNYSEVDQMGVVYHARYLVWLDMARTEYLRRQGMSYRELEDRGFRLAVGELSIRYRQPGRYDDLIRVRCWVENVGSRRVTFGYAVELEPSGKLLATATTAMLSLNPDFTFSAMPADVQAMLVPTTSPVRL
jgi:acyl-CoA thioester hydrolase